MTSLASTPINRRQLLKLGLGASATLATVGMTATLTGCSSSQPGSGYAVLRDSDIPVLGAIISALIGPHPALDKDTLQTAIQQLDTTLAWTSSAVQSQVTDLLGMLSMPLTRGPMTGIWGSWDNASRADVQAFLQRWRDSSLDMLRQGHTALSQLLLMAWYATPASWPAAGYPGPPQI